MMKKILIFIFYVVAYLLVLGSLFSIFRNSGVRYLKMLDFPRIQFFIATFLLLIVFFFTVKKWLWYNLLLIIGLLAGLMVQGFFLVNYTPLVPVAVPWTNHSVHSTLPFSILLCNVKMNNRNSKPLLDLVVQKDPDIILAMEVDKWWNEQLKVLGNRYPYSQHTVNKVTYGMVLYSKYPLKKVEVDYLNNAKVPSFETTVSLSEAKNINLHCIHPVPPTTFKELPDNAGQQAEALEKLGNQVEDRKLPTMVAGDLNDVVWSYVDELTETENILFDVRVGRGFYNSYNAKNFFMRWPLDHVFVSEEFSLQSLERLPYIGSDHFPIFVKLVL